MASKESKHQSNQLGGKSSPFTRIATAAARAAGQPWTFALAALVVIIWAILGPVFGFSDTWQLVINTGTTIVTFLMVFLIQNTQNRDGVALQIKLDEIIRATKGHNALLDLEELSQEDLDRIRNHYCKLAEKARTARRQGKKDTDSPFVALD